jgi:polar amino acid transport system substrate-binding protein
VLISIFTGTVATLLTIEHLGPQPRAFEDLGRARIVSVTGSAAAQLLDARQLTAELVPDLEAAIAALREDRADALVFDRALLAAAVKAIPGVRITILPSTLRPEFYAIAIHPSEPLRRQLNVAIGRTLDSPRWGRWRYEYLGSQADDR